MQIMLLIYLNLIVEITDTLDKSPANAGQLQLSPKQAGMILSFRS